MSMSMDLGNLPFMHGLAVTTVVAVTNWGFGVLRVLGYTASAALELSAIHMTNCVSITDTHKPCDQRRTGSWNGKLCVCAELGYSGEDGCLGSGQSVSL